MESCVDLKDSKPTFIAPSVTDSGSQLIEGLRELLGSKYVTSDPCLLDTYAWQLNGDSVNGDQFVRRFLAVVLPKTTEEVAGIVKLCVHFGFQYKASATGLGPWNGPGVEDAVIQIDLRRMNNFEIDDKNMFAVVESYVTNNQLQTECMKLGLHSHIHGAGGQASQLASATSFNGHGPDGISCGFSSRNVLGFEWVTPEGEIVKAGSFDSSGSWFNGDGPGPSLRGVMRGFFGAMGGLGVFTKVAVKVYPWNGPKKLKVEGYSPSYYFNIPKYHGCGFVSLPANDIKARVDFGYAIGETEVCSHIINNSPALTIAALVPSNNKAVEGFKVPLLNDLHDNFYLIFMAKHEKEYRYKQRVLNKLASDANGGFMGSDDGLVGLRNKFNWARRVVKDLGIYKTLKSLKWSIGYMKGELQLHGFDKLHTGNGTPLESNLYGALLRAGSNIRAVASMGGSFITTMGSLLPWDAVVRSQQIHLAIRKDLLKKGKLLMQDQGDGDHGCMYEAGAYTHTESVVLYDPTDKSMQDIIKNFNATMDDASINHKVGTSIASFGPKGAAMYSEPMLNYDTYTQRIKAVFDPFNSADGSYYTDSKFKLGKEAEAVISQAKKERVPASEIKFPDNSRYHASKNELAWIEKRGYGELEVGC
jgi:glycolate oxidase